MPFETVQDAIDQVAKNVGLTSGDGMTPYSPDLVLSWIVAAHELIVDEQEWDEMIVWRERTLDGAVGKITQLITDTKDWKKIRRIYHESFGTPLNMLSSYANPLTSTLLLGYRGLAPVDDNTVGDGRYLVQFYPVTLTGRVLFQLERAIDWTVLDQPLPIDWWWHVHLASYIWAVSDGGNMAQAQMFQQLTQQRKGQVNAKQNTRHLVEQPNQMIPNDWFEQDAPYA